MALRPISRLDGFTFPEGAWDVRGWTVRTQPDDRKVGKVEDMLLDHAGGLRYLDVNLGFLKKHVLVPLDHAHAEEEGDRVWIRNLTRDELERVPEYALDPESLDEAYERRLDATYGGTAASRHRDLVAPTPDEDAELPLERMARLEDEYRVAGDDPRGWKLVTADGRSVGRVAELLVDPGTMKAQFMDVALDEDELELEPVDRHVLLPVDRVRLDRKARSAVVAALMGHDLADYPQYGGLPVRNRAVREIQEYIAQAGLSPDERRARNGEGTAPRDDDWRDSTLRTFYGDTHRTRRTPPREPTTED